MDSNYPQIALQGIGGLIFVRTNEVLYANADGNYSNVYLTENREIKILRQLKEIEELIPNENFIRIHRAHFINLEHVIRLENEQIMMSDNNLLPLARDRKMEFIEKFTRI